eukprot:scaffold36559_cov58-Phaeocystis_antarctica.AAC.1
MSHPHAHMHVHVHEHEHEHEHDAHAHAHVHVHVHVHGHAHAYVHVGETTTKAGAGIVGSLQVFRELSRTSEEAFSESNPHHQGMPRPCTPLGRPLLLMITPRHHCTRMHAHAHSTRTQAQPQERLIGLSWSVCQPRV